MAVYIDELHEAGQARDEMGEELGRELEEERGGEREDEFGFRGAEERWEEGREEGREAGPDVEHRLVRYSPDRDGKGESRGERDAAQ